MRLVLRSQVRAARNPAARCDTATPARSAGDTLERRAWIEALFGEHLPRTASARERAIEVLAGDGSVWRLLHQARHSMAETTATIERLARAALNPEPALADAPRAA